LKALAEQAAYTISKMVTTNLTMTDTPGRNLEQKLLHKDCRKPCKHRQALEEFPRGKTQN
jgi:hypothetical protein